MGEVAHSAYVLLGHGMVEQEAYDRHCQPHLRFEEDDMF
jgi:hypothetical protein